MEKAQSQPFNFSLGDWQRKVSTSVELVGHRNGHPIIPRLNTIFVHESKKNYLLHPVTDLGVSVKAFGLRQGMEQVINGYSLPAGLGSFKILVLCPRQVGHSFICLKAYPSQDKVFMR
jgi:hypothetical protein